MRRIAAAIVCLALVSCAGAEQTRGAATPTTASDPEFVNGAECPPSRHDDLPNDAGCVSTAARGEQRLRVYALLGPDDRPRSWHMRFASGGDEAEQRLRAGNVTSYPRALGATDLDSDGVPEWWVKTADYASHGAAWAGLTIFVFTDDSLKPVTHEGESLTVNFGGISRLGEGAVCRDGRVVTLRVWARDRQNTKWWISERTFELDGTRARLVDQLRRSMEIETYSDPRLARNYRVECDGQTFTPY